MKRTARLPARPAIVLAVLIWAGAAQADGIGYPEAVELSHCGTPPTSRAEVVRGPRLGLDAATGAVVRRNSTFPRYPCADAPQGPGWGVHAIDVLIDAPRPRPGPRGVPPWRRSGGAPR